MTISEALELWTRKPSILAHLPPALLLIAQCPILRRSGASGGWAIGNVADVVLARRFVYAALAHRGAPEAGIQFRALGERERGRREELERIRVERELGRERAGRRDDWEMEDEDGPNVAKWFYEAMFKDDDNDGQRHTRAAKALSKVTRMLRNRNVPLERWVNYVHIGA